MTYFGMILRTQWAWTRIAVAMLSLVSFLMPAVIWRIGSRGFGGSGTRTLVAAFEMTGPFLSVVAVLGAFVLAALPWIIDNESKHVYALSLPMPWSQFVAMRFGAGALTLLAPALALYLGALAVLAMIEMPPLLRGYPGSLSLRFLLALLVAYAASFALQYIAGRRAAIVMLIALLVISGLSVIFWALGVHDVIDSVGKFLFVWPGPFAVFAEPWTLIDV